MKKSYLTAAFAMLLLAGCNTDLKESDYKFGDDEGAKVTFSAVIKDQNPSAMRALATSWEEGDVIGITCGSKQINVAYEYTATSGNYFKAIDRTQEIWLMGTEEYNVSAYHPYTGSDGEASAPLVIETTSENQATLEGRQQLDFLYASGVANRENPNVELAFSHVMSRIVLTFQGDGIDLTDIDCYITGLKLVGSFNPNSGEIKLDEEAAIESVNQVLTEANQHTMTAIFIPQPVTKELLIEAGMSGIYYKIILPAADIPELKAGYSYHYTITAQNYSDDPIKLTITGTQIIPWITSDGGILTPDPGLAGTETGIGSSDWGDIDNEDITPTEKK